jgi:hypothetical protein
LASAVQANVQAAVSAITSSRIGSTIGGKLRRNKALGGAALAALLALTACSELGGFRLRASDLEIGPNPAVPGDQMVATFIVILAPTQRHTVILTINDTEHSRVTSNDAPEIPYVISLGDAADLIARYGTGTHSARVEVHAEEANESARTQSETFELRDAAP